MNLKSSATNFESSKFTKFDSLQLKKFININYCTELTAMVNSLRVDIVQTRRILIFVFLVVESVVAPLKDWK